MVQRGRPKEVTRSINQLAKEFGIQPQTVRKNLRDGKYGVWKWDGNERSGRVVLKADYHDFHVNKDYQNTKIITKEPETDDRDYENYFYIQKYETEEEAREAAVSQVDKEIDEEYAWTEGLSPQEIEAKRIQQEQRYFLQNLEAKKRVKKKGPKTGERWVAAKSLPVFLQTAEMMDDVDKVYFIDQCYEYTRLFIDSETNRPPNVWQQGQIIAQVIDEINLHRKQMRAYQNRDMADEDLQKEIDSLSKRIDSRAASLGLTRKRGDTIAAPGGEDDGRVKTPGQQEYGHVH